MSFEVADQELRNRMVALGFHASPDSSDVQDLVDADLRKFERSFLLRLASPAEPLGEFALNLTHFKCDLELQIGANIGKSRSVANRNLNSYMVTVWGELVSDMSWAAHVKSILPISKPQIYESPTHPDRLVIGWQWQIVFTEV
jgi:hypothetical protein